MSSCWNQNYFQISVSNSSNHDIVLKKNTIIGRAEYIKSITPLAVQFNPNNISVSLIHTNEEDKCNLIKHKKEEESQPGHQSTTIREEKTEAVPKSTIENQ